MAGRRRLSTWWRACRITHFQREGNNLRQRLSVDLYHMILAARRPCPPQGPGLTQDSGRHPHRQVTACAARGCRRCGIPRISAICWWKCSRLLPQDLPPREIELFRELADLRK
jgi:hypothetical protein